MAVKIHKMSLKLPKYEIYEEGSQLRRSSKGITSCIVEGYGRKKYKADFIKFLVHAHASCDETILHLNFIKDIHEINEREINPPPMNFETKQKLLAYFKPYNQKLSSMPTIGMIATSAQEIIASVGP